MSNILGRLCLLLRPSTLLRLAQIISSRCHQPRYLELSDFAIFHIQFLSLERRLLFHVIRYRQRQRETPLQLLRTRITHISSKALSQPKVPSRPLRHTADSIRHLLMWIEVHSSIASYREALRSTQARASCIRRQARVVKALHQPARLYQTQTNISRDFRHRKSYLWDSTTSNAVKRQLPLPEKVKPMADQCLCLQTRR